MDLFPNQEETTKAIREPTLGAVSLFPNEGPEVGTLEQSFRLGSKKSPEASARSLRLQIQTGLPLEVVERNINEVERRSMLGDVDFEKLRKSSPVVSSWLSQHPNHAALAQGDTGVLARIENTISSFGRGLSRALNQERMADILYKEMEFGLTPTERARLQKLREEQSKLARIDQARGVPEYIAGTTAYTVFQLGNVAWTAIKGSATGGVAVGLLSSVIPGITTAVGGEIGMMAGGTTAVVYDTYYKEAAFAWDEFRGLNDIEGNPIDPAIARNAARVVGSLNALIEFVSDILLARLIPGFNAITKGFGGDAAKRLIIAKTKAVLTTPSRRAILLSALGKMGKASFIEGLEEFVQSLVSSAGREAAQAVSPQTFVPDSLGEDVEQASREALDAAVGIFFTFAPVGGVHFYQQSRKVYKASIQQDFFKALGENVKNSKTFQRLPEKMQEIVENITKDGPVETLYQDIETWNTYWQEKGLDPRAAAEEVTGDTKSYDEALQTGGQIEISTAAYAVKLAPTEHNTFFAQELRTEPEAMNGREAEEFIRQLPKLAEAASRQEQKQAGEDPIIQSAAQVRQDVAQQLVESGIRQDIAESYGNLYEATFRVLGQRTGIDPLELYQRRGLSIQGSLPDEQQKTQTFEQADEEEKARGALHIGPDKRLNIELLKDANLSTFLHETGHFYLEVLRDISAELVASDPEALTQGKRQLLEDQKTILSWLGVESWDQIETPQHEQWAKGFEAYLMEGKAPTPELRRTFARFRAWLLAIYKHLSVYFQNIKLTPEVRSVLDRMVATEEEIEAAQVEQNMQPLFSDPKMLGLSKLEYEKYLEAVEEAKKAAEEELTGKLMAEWKREQTAWWKEERKKVRAKIEDEVNSIPVYRAINAMQKGTLPNGSPLPDGMNPIKLSKDALVEQFGKDILRKLPRPYIYVRQGGVTADFAAEQFGYTSGEKLVREIIVAQNKKELIKTRTDKRMKELHGDLVSDEKLSERAMDAVHNEKRAQLLRMELKWLAENRLVALKGLIGLVGRKVPALGIITAEAQRAIAGRKIRDIRPSMYKMAENRAAREAVQALRRGDFQIVFDAKLRELINHEYYRAAVKARENVDSGVEFTRKFRRKSIRKAFGKTDYLPQLDNILSRFEFAYVPLSELEERKKTLDEWINEKEQNGESLGEPIEASWRLKDETFKTNYKELTFKDFQGIIDILKQIDHMRIQAGKTMAAQKKARREEVKAQLIAAIKANYEFRPIQPLTKAGLSAKQKVYAFGREVDASLLKMEQLIEWMDGGDINGPWHTFLWHPASEAQTAEYDYTKKITAKVAEAVIAMPKKIRSRILQRVYIPGVERVVTRKDLIGIGLNSGNESNFSKMVRGEAMQSGGLTEDQIRAALDLLTAEEIEFVNSIWEILETMWPDIAKLHKELTGIELARVIPRSLQLENGTLKGGYYPMIYRKHASKQGKKQEMSARVGDLQSDGYVSATTYSGYRKERVKKFAAPVDLDIELLPSHVSNVIKDLTHRKWMIDAKHIIDDPDIKSAINDYLGEEYEEMLDGWVKQVVNDKNHASLSSLGVWRRLLEVMRFNFLVAAMGFKASTEVSQLAGMGPAIEVLGGVRYYRKGLMRVLNRPRESYRLMVEKSGEMRHRIETRDREMRDKLRDLRGKKTLKAQIQEFSLYALGWADLMVSMPAWWGGYLKALDEDLDEQSAVYSGDRVVRLSQGAAGAKDLAAVQSKNSDVMRLLTMFYTPFSALYARLRDIQHAAGTKHSGPQVAMRVFWVWIWAATVAEIISGRGPDDDEGWVKWWLKNVALYPFATIPGVRDIANAVFSDYSYNFTPISQAGKQIANTIKTGVNVTQGDEEVEAIAHDLLLTAGYVFGWPVAQLDITGEYIIDLMQEDVAPDDLGEFAHDILFRRPRERNRN